jgi:colanic acid/amylovoran biosynthesis glycosyltransferase
MPIVASYCTTFLKPEMLHIYRQVTGLRRWRTFVVCKERQHADRFPFSDVEIAPRVRSNFLRRGYLKYFRREPPIVYRGEYGVLARLLERREADLVHVYFGHAGVHLLPFLRRWPKPALVSFHGMDVQTRAGRPGYEENLRALLHELPLVLVRSESLRDRLIALGCSSAKIRLNRTGVPMDIFPVLERPRPIGAWHLVQACRLIEKKGIDIALGAFARFLALHPGSTFTIAGEGPLREPMAQQVARAGLTASVYFTGFLDQAALRDLYHRSHVFVHPSRMTADQNQEGIPNSMIEAMATGLPVLATRHGGIPEAVEHGRSGLLVAEDDQTALFENMRRLAEEPALWESLSHAAAADVRARFEHSAQIATLEACYDEAISTGSQGRSAVG